MFIREYHDYPAHKPPVLGLYACKVFVYDRLNRYCIGIIIGEWLGDRFYFGPEHAYRDVIVNAWAAFEY